ncbi:MAG: sulfotransferase [Thermosynechococcaceae cyanobacterium]
MSDYIKGRIFIVGCPRSGTTLLQSFLTAHSEVESFPESQFFLSLDHNSPLLSLMRIASPKAKDRLSEFLSHIDSKETSETTVTHALFKQQYIRKFTLALDTLTKKNGKRVWLEKSPRHLICIKEIERSVHKAKFIHIIRDGADVVASIYDAALKYPNTGWESYQDIDQCVYLWTKYKSISERYRYRPNHIIVHYESLVSDTRISLNRVCDFINIKYEEEILSSYKDSYKKIVNKDELWKSGINSSTISYNRNKFNEIFDRSQQEYILKKLSMGFSETHLQKLKRKIKDTVF